MDVLNDFVKDDLGLSKDYLGEDFLFVKGVFEHGLQGVTHFFELPILLILLWAAACDVGIEGPHALWFGFVVIFYGITELWTGFFLLFFLS